VHQATVRSGRAGGGSERASSEPRRSLHIVFFIPGAADVIRVPRRLLARELAHEGGHSNHPSSPGGTTNFCTMIADYRRYVKPGATAACEQCGSMRPRRSTRRVTGMRYVATNCRPAST